MALVAQVLDDADVADDELVVVWRRSVPEPLELPPPPEAGAAGGLDSVFVRSSEVVNGRELADRLGVNARSLRAVIRKHELAPSHRHGEFYALDPDEQARIAAHPAVKRLVAENRR